METNSYVISLFLIHKKLNTIGLGNTHRVFFERSGFEIIFNKSDDLQNVFDDLTRIEEYDDWFIALDLIPWKNEKSDLKNISWNSSSKNHRIEWSIYTVKRYLKEQLSYDNPKHKENFPNEPLICLSTTSEINSKFHQFYPNVINQIHQKVIDFSSRFKIIRQLTDYGCNNRIDLVEFRGNKYICKTFKPDKLKYLDNEIIAREEFNGLINIPPIILRGKNFILIKYFEKTKSLYFFYNKYKLLRVNIAKRIFSDLKVIYNKGYIHLDFHPGNILINENKEIVYIDFEYLDKHNFEWNIMKSPGIIEHNKLIYNSPLEHITFKNYWYNHINISLSNLLYSPLAILYIIRFFTMIKIISKRYYVKVIKQTKKLISKYE